MGAAAEDRDWPWRTATVALAACQWPSDSRGRRHWQDPLRAPGLRVPVSESESQAGSESQAQAAWDSELQPGPPSLRNYDWINLSLNVMNRNY